MLNAHLEKLIPRICFRCQVLDNERLLRLIFCFFILNQEYVHRHVFVIKDCQQQAIPEIQYIGINGIKLV